MNYFKILRILQKGDKTLFDIPVKEQKAFLDSLGEPKDDIDRSYKQYLCQNFFVPKGKVWLFNIVATIIVPLIILLFLLKGLFVKKSVDVPVIIESKGMNEVVPLIVQEKYNPDDRFWHEAATLKVSDVPFLMKMIIRNPRHPYFVLKALMNIAYYSDLIRRHHPCTIIQFGEFSFSSSILTAYCHQYGVNHVDIMHGEKLYFIRDSFFHYDECYVWHEYYSELFRSLKAEPTQFRVALPPSMHIDIESYKKTDAFADYKYYLAIYDEEQIKDIVQSMAFAERKGNSVRYRPHPRYSDMNLLRKYVPEDKIEMPKEVDILESISNLTYAVGSYTTVLSQAFFSGKKVILDDITFKSQYNQLKEMEYILSATNSTKLSECQNS